MGSDSSDVVVFRSTLELLFGGADFRAWDRFVFDGAVYVILRIDNDWVTVRAISAEPSNVFQTCD